MTLRAFGNMSQDEARDALGIPPESVAQPVVDFGGLTYPGNGSKLLSVTATEDGLEFRFIASGDVTTALGFTPVTNARTISTTAPLTGGGDLTANRTIGITGSALTKTDDTNVTLTLGGTPASALLAAASITVGWAGTLDLTRGGTGSGTAAGARTNLGLDTMATQAASNVSITGGSVAATSALSLTINQNATTFVGVTNTDTTNSNSRAEYRLTAGSVGGRFTALQGSLVVVGTTSAHDLVLQRNGSNVVQVSANGAIVTGSVRPTSYTVAGVPSASTHGAGAMIYVSNESGGAVIAFSDGTNWRRVTDRAVIS